MPRRRYHQLGSRPWAWKWLGICRMMRSTDHSPEPKRVGHPGQLSQHVLDVVFGRRGTVVLPHHHRHPAHLAVGHPAHVVLVVPFRQTRRLAEVTTRIERERHPAGYLVNS